MPKTRPNYPVSSAASTSFGHSTPAQVLLAHGLLDVDVLAPDLVVGLKLGQVDHLVEYA